MSQYKASDHLDSPLPEWQQFIQALDKDEVPIIGIG